jgi:proton glutamate symport protein
MIRRFFDFLFRIPLLVWILVFTVLGVVLGLYAKDFSINFMALFSSHIFLPMVKSIIVPLVFSTLVVGIAGHGSDLAKLGRLAAKSMSYFFSLTIVAVFIGLGWANLFRPGDGINLPILDSNSEKDIKNEKTEISFACTIPNSLIT